MARYPGAIWNPVTAKNRQRMVWYRRVNLHVAVSEARSLKPYFNQKGIPDSHFYVRKDGTVEQMVDTDYQAYADLDGNDATISIETQGGLTNTSTEKWTPAQVDTLARIYAWAVETHGIPVKLASDSKIGTSSHGLSWHRLGIDGNFPSLPSVLAGRRQRGGGMRYSHSAGKVCPGDAKIRQVFEVFTRAQTYIDNPKNDPEDDMPSAEEIAKEVWRYELGELEIDGEKIAAENAGTRLNWNRRYAVQQNRRMKENLILTRSYEAALDALARSQGHDSAAITKAVKESVDAALKSLSITLTTED